jgi:hypothetical protein
MDPERGIVSLIILVCSRFCLKTQKTKEIYVSRTAGQIISNETVGLCIYSSTKYSTCVDVVLYCPSPKKLDSNQFQRRNPYIQQVNLYQYMKIDVHFIYRHSGLKFDHMDASKFLCSDHVARLLKPRSFYSFIDMYW